eukprot:3291503-Alexandrium_andersonii.AAC.1
MDVDGGVRLCCVCLLALHEDCEAALAGHVSACATRARPMSPPEFPAGAHICSMCRAQCVG